MKIYQKLVSSIIITLLASVSINAQSEMLNMNSTINPQKELNLCMYILEFDSKSNLRKRFNLKALPKNDMKQELVKCIKLISEIKLKNRMKACREKILINDKYKFDEKNKQQKKAFEKKFTQCVYNNW